MTDSIRPIPRKPVNVLRKDSNGVWVPIEGVVSVSFDIDTNPLSTQRFGDREWERAGTEALWLSFGLYPKGGMI